MKKNLRKLLAKVKQAAGFPPNYRWEVALNFREDNANKPFRQDDDNYKWAGDIAPLSCYASKVKVGTYLECWIYSPGESGELEDNVYIWVDSDTSARVRVCGCLSQTVTL